MAAKPAIRFLLILILILAGVAVIKFTRSRFLFQNQKDDDRFISTYIGLSLASEKYSTQPDSCRINAANIFAENGTDSVWMADYTMKLSGDITKSSILWQRIVAKLDTIRQELKPKLPQTSISTDPK